MLKLSNTNNPIVSFKDCLFIGVPVILVSLVLMFTNPQSQNNLPKGFSTPILALEFLQNQEEAINLFNVENRNQYIDKFILGNKIDYLFMVLYSLFMMCIGYKISLITKNKTLYFSMFLALLAMITDFVENQYILKIIHNYNEEIVTGYIQKLNLFTWIKWGSIAVFFFIISGYFFKGNTFSKVIGIVGILIFITAIGAFIHRSILNEIMGGLIALNFLLLIIYCFTQKKIKVESF